MLYHNENDSDGIQQVLTAQRGVNALFELANGFTPDERLEGLHLEIADWHAGNKFLKV